MTKSDKSYAGTSATRLVRESSGYVVRIMNGALANNCWSDCFIEGVIVGGGGVL